MLVLVCAAGWSAVAYAQTNVAPQIDSTGPFAVVEGSTVVDTLSATDPDTAGDELVWSIPPGAAGGADADKFTLSTSGALSFAAVKDYENPDDADADGTYGVVVQVSDGAATDTADLEVTLENAVELLSEVSGPATVSFEEGRWVRVAAYSASSEEDRDGVAWSLSGDDSGDFTIDGGVLRFAATPDYEEPADADDGNDYGVTVTARVGTVTVTKDVTVTVTDGDEAGLLKFLSSVPEVGTAVTASVSDPDGVSVTSWQWQRSTGRAGWTAIAGAESASYTPTNAVAGHYLRAIAIYTDSHGEREAMALAPNVVLSSHRLSRLDIAGGIRPAMHPAFDPNVLHYGIGCVNGGATDGSLTLTVAAADPASRLAVDGVQVANRGGEITVHNLHRESDIEITVSGSDGAATIYTVHCIDSAGFPDIVATKKAGAVGVFEDLAVFTHDYSVAGGYLIVTDNNGVPRARKHTNTHLSPFHRVFEGNARQYAYASRLPGARAGAQITFLDNDFATVDASIGVRSPLSNTDGHDFLVLPNGDYVLLSYEPARRDFGFLTDNYGITQSGGAPWGTEDTRDSAIQVRPAQGAARLTWYSWGNMAIEDCLTHRFPDDYAHVNSLQWVDGDIVSSFRGCNKVLRIDAATGSVVWRLGRSVWSRSEWEAGRSSGSGPPPLEIVGDPYGEFCGQHAAQLLPNGHLLLYDNGVHCFVDPVAGDGHRESGVFSRGVEYALDVDNGEAVFVRHHSLHNAYDRVGKASGHIEPLEGGDWLMSWGSGTWDDDPDTPLPPDHSATQVDPDTHEEKFSLTVSAPMSDVIEAIRAIPISPVSLARTPQPLRAEFPDGGHSSGFFTQVSDRPQVVVAFNQPVVDFEADTPSIEVSGATVAEVGALAVPGEQAYAYLLTLAPEGEAPVTVRLVTGRACDDGGICTADGSVLSTVPASRRVRFNAPPVVEGDLAFDVDENTTAVATLRARDPDTVSSRLVWSIPSDAPGADGTEFELSARGVLSLAEGKDFEAPDDADGDGTYEVRVQVSDGDSAVTALMSVTVVNVDEPADISFSASGGVTASDNALGVDENHDGALAAFGASDPENKVGLTYMWSLGGSDRGDFAITDAGVLSFAAVPDFERPADSGGNNVYDITVSALDSDNNTGTIAVTVTVDPVNEPPTIGGDAAASIEEEGALLIGTYRAADPERAVIVWQPLAGADGDRFEFTASNGRLVFKSAPDYEDATYSGRDNVYDVTLGVSAGGDTTTLDVAVSVTNKEEGGALGLSSPQPQADADYTATLSDPDGVVSTGWTWERSASRSGPWTAVSGATSSVTTSVYRPGAGDVGYFLRVSAAYTDGHGPDKSRAVVSTDSVQAAPVTNVPPSFEDRAPTRSVGENALALAAVGMSVTATDTDSGDVVTYGLSGSALFTINSSSGQISVVADGSLDHETAPSHRVTVKASDTTNASDAVTVTIEVTDVNERPDADADTGTVREDGAVIIDVLANDSDPDDDRSALTLRVTASPRRGSATVNEPANVGERRTITYTPNENYHGSDVFTYEVSDAGSPSLSSTATVSVEVDAVNDPPTFKSAATTRSVSQSATGGAKVGAPVTATDVDDNDTLTYSLSGIEARFFAIGARSGQITVGDGVTFDIATKDTYTVTVHADDTSFERATVEVTITVTSGPPKPPITGGGGGGGDPVVVVEIDGRSFAAADTEAVFTAAVSDGTTISVLSWTVTGPDGFAATDNAERFSFAAPVGGTYTLSVTIEDTAGGTLTGRVTLTVFGDITAHQFADEMLWLAEEGITRGCAVAHSFCPSSPVTRAQMASFLARALDLQAPRQSAGFDDVDPTSAHAANIEALYAAQITTGCNQEPLQYCPSKPVTRAQMASFLARALDLETPRQRAGFDDVDPSSAHAANIEALYAAQITTGCTQDPLAYCPSRPVTRAQMAAFLARALNPATNANPS